VRLGGVGEGSPFNDSRNNEVFCIFCYGYPIAQIAYDAFVSILTGIEGGRLDPHLCCNFLWLILALMA